MPEEEAEEGAPAWMLTYGDMITLILCFFVLLFSMSEIKKDKLSKTMRAFQAQFGVLPAQKATVQVFVVTMRMTETMANVLRRGPSGDNVEVQNIVEDDKNKIVIGGVRLFDKDSDRLTPGGQQLLRENIAEALKGFRNRIDVRGHTAASKFGSEAKFQDSWYLGYRRAHAVMRYLTEKCGVDKRRFRVTSCADHAPRNSNLTEEGRQRNMRVEIIMTEEFIRDIDHLEDK